MPYLIITTRATRPSQLYGESPVLDQPRRAVTTLDEARGLVAAEINRVSPANLHPAVAQYDALGESGGTVGPLPDGTVIEVKPWAPTAMRAWAHYYAPGVDKDDEAEIIHAYNAGR